jgi:molybdopterin synthase sulfur carrier subunit
MATATIRIPTPLRRVTNGQDSVSVDAVDLGQSLGELDSQFPGVKERIVDVSSGELHRFVNIYINGEDVRFLEGLRTVIKEGDEVSIVPAVAGG